MATGFLSHLMRPIRHLIRPPSSKSNPEGSQQEEPQPATPPRSSSPEPCDLNPLIQISTSMALDWIQRDLGKDGSGDVMAQLSSIFRSSAQVFTSICGSSSQISALHDAPEALVMKRLEQRSSSQDTLQALVTENKDLQLKLQMNFRHSKKEVIIASLEEKLMRSDSLASSRAVDLWRDAENRARSQSELARKEIVRLREALSAERRGNSELVAALKTLHASGADTTVLESFVADRARGLQREVFVKVKSGLLKKIWGTYPDADMDYFADMKQIPDIDLLPEWLKFPDDEFDDPSSLPKPPTSSRQLQEPTSSLRASKKRRTQ